MGIVAVDTDGQLYAERERGEEEEKGEGEDKGGRGGRKELHSFPFPTSNHEAELMVGWAPYVPPLYGSSRSENKKHLHLSGPKGPVIAITTTVLDSNSLYYGLGGPRTSN